jgi:Transglycosylase SLT domain
VLIEVPVPRSSFPPQDRVGPAPDPEGSDLPVRSAGRDDAVECPRQIMGDTSAAGRDADTSAAGRDASASRARALVCSAVLLTLMAIIGMPRSSSHREALSGASGIGNLEQAESADALAAPDPIRPLLVAAALEHDLPVDFFTRLLRKESRFDPQAVSPAGARGIAQFMPRTAAERGLEDPFDPAQALPAAAEFLSELRKRFGNLGLAAAAYNAGPRRVQDWLDKKIVALPRQTRDYVQSITGRPVEEWALADRSGASTGLATAPEPAPDKAVVLPAKPTPAPVGTEELLADPG